MPSVKYSKLEDPAAVIPHHRFLDQRRWRIMSFVLVSALLFFLFNPLAAWSVPRAVTKSSPTPLHPELCQSRFWGLRYASYCDNVSQAQEWKQPSFNTTTQAPLDVFEVYPPVRVGGKYLAGTADDQAAIAQDESGECTVLMMQHTFGYSYGEPFVGNYTPPSCEWTNVLFNLTMTSQGRQYDRLALMFLGDVEVFRTSTAEPTSYGIIFNYVKDMTRFSALLKEPQEIIFDLGNLISDVYTGSYNATLTATFYNPPKVNAADPADSILPISKQIGSTGQPSQFSLPSDTGITSLTLPSNAIRAIVSVTATGDSTEEFWYTNVPSTYAETWPETTLYGYSPFREVQVLIDGNVAGVVWPFDSVYTGGISPAFWRPIVGITTFDLPEYEIDVTPFLPLLLDGDAHDFQIRVMTYDENTNSLSTALGSDWIASGRVFVWTDSGNHTTTGTVMQQSVSDPVFTYDAHLTQLSNGTNNTLEVSISAHRSISFVSSISTSAGNKSVSWTQGLHYTNTMFLSEEGNLQTVDTTTSGSDATFADGSRYYTYPFHVDQYYNPNAALVNIEGNITQTMQKKGVTYLTEGNKNLVGYLDTTLNSHSDWELNVGGNGTTSQDYTWHGSLENAEGVASYERKVSSVDNVNYTYVASNEEEINGVGVY